MAKRRIVLAHAESYAGRSSIRAELVGETPSKYRLKWLQSAFRFRVGQISLVPKYAVTMTDEYIGEDSGSKQ